MAEEVLERATEHARRAGSRSQEGEIARLLTLVISQGPDCPSSRASVACRPCSKSGVTDRKLEVAVASKRRRVGGDARAVRARRGSWSPARRRSLESSATRSRCPERSPTRRGWRCSRPHRRRRSGRRVRATRSSIGWGTRGTSRAPPRTSATSCTRRGGTTKRTKLSGVHRTDHGRRRCRRRGALALAACEDARPARPVRRGRAVRDGGGAHRRSDRLPGSARRCPRRPRGGVAARGSDADAAAALGDAIELRRRKGNLVGAARAESSLAELGS